MLDELKSLLNVLLDAIAGAILGLVIGAGTAYLFAINTPYNKAIGSQDSQAMAKGMTMVGLIFIGGCLGFVIALVISIVREARKNASNQSSN